ncbi:MAG: hypothetical protein KDA31_01745 [Phycisphaerales bacterium]|nr:hypothetical protein [Phycisphaerales bacterium]MCB9835100.1 hypothetical protein [Phycisphaera sp.]
MIEATLADNALADSLAHYLLPIVAIVAGVIVGSFAITCGVMHSVAVKKARENTKRELSAYVAEGTITPDDAVRILAVGLTNEKGSKDMLAQVLAAGSGSKATPARNPAHSPQPAHA